MKNTKTLLLQVLGFGVVGLVAVLSVFVYLYLKSGKFRKSFFTAVLVVSPIFGPGAVSIARGVDGFTPPKVEGESGRIQTQGILVKVVMDQILVLSLVPENQMILKMRMKYLRSVQNQNHLKQHKIDLITFKNRLKDWTK